MKVIYLNHSGFLLEAENCCFLFDYFKGEIPNLDRFHQIFVFVSHWHADHYNQDIFKLLQKYKTITYVLDEKVKVPPDILQNTSIEKGTFLFVKADNTYELKDTDGNELKIITLHSTDIGVAFYLEYLGKCFYHAGDLNLWVWKEESVAYNHNMKANFDRQMKKLKGKHIDVAFVPLDPRQEDGYAAGMLSLLQTADISTIFPMHFWGKHDIIAQFLQEYSAKLNHTRIMQIQKDGEEFTI